MSCHRSYAVLASLLLLAGSGAIPVSHAQTGPIVRLFQPNDSGSFLGVQMDDVTSANMSKYKLNAERGVIVTSVTKGSPAESANIREGDVIQEFGGFQVWSSAQLARLVSDTPPGRKVELIVSRDGKQMNLTAQIAKNDDRRVDERRFYGRNVFPRDFSGQDWLFRQLPNPPNLPNPQRPRLGVTLLPLTDQLAEYFGVPGKNGALISSVASGSPSDGKLKSGDVVVAAGGSEINSPEDLSDFIRSKGEGNITLKVIRDKKALSVTVSLSSADEEGGSQRL